MSLKHKIDSIQWIFFKNENFEQTCISSGFDKSYVRKVAKDFLEGVIDEPMAYQMLIEKKSQKAMQTTQEQTIENYANKYTQKSARAGL